MSLTWSVVQATYSPEPVEWLARAQVLGLEWPLDVFEAIFIDHRLDADFVAMVKSVDWSRMGWSELCVSGVALRSLSVPPEYLPRVNEARARTSTSGFHDERYAVMEHWLQAKTWVRSPILIAGTVVRCAAQYELIVGMTRLGNMLGALDHGELPESAQHTVWLGRES
jgi:hypothetical protein